MHFNPFRANLSHYSSADYIMGRGKAITDYERGQIKAMRVDGVLPGQIARRIGRSCKLVSNCFARGIENPSKVSSGRKKISSPTEIRLMRRNASNNSKSSARLKGEMHLNVSSRTIRRYLNESGNLKYQKMLVSPCLSKADKLARVCWARDHMQWKEEWLRTVFSDEKKFNLDGPDGFAYYWHDLRKEKVIFSKRNYGGGSLMVWIGLSKDFKAKLYVIDGSLNSVKYQALLGTVFEPLRALVDGRYAAGTIFQQDNASPHTAKATSAWLVERNITRLPWVARSPDLNIVENLFGIICRDVYVVISIRLSS
jgi:transposase